MNVLFRLLSHWPLPLLHALGAGLGWVVYALSPGYRRNVWAQARHAGVSGPAVWASVAETGKMVAELPRLWLGPSVPVDWDGDVHIDRAHAEGQGILFITPHMGCFEITARAYAERYGAADPSHKAMTVLFRPPRQAGLRDTVAHARQRPGLCTAPTTLAGVKQLVKVLRGGGAVGLLPDQVPPQGQGVWAPFFGRPAYTMTLSTRLAQTSRTRVMLAWGERLPRGRGYVVHVRPLEHAWSAEPVADATAMNAALEELIATCPAQYLWGYARYKTPRPADGEGVS